MPVLPLLIRLRFFSFPFPSASSFARRKAGGSSPLSRSIVRNSSTVNLLLSVFRNSSNRISSVCFVILATCPTSLVVRWKLFILAARINAAPTTPAGLRPGDIQSRLKRWTIRTASFATFIFSEANSRRSAKRRTKSSGLMGWIRPVPWRRKASMRSL